MSEKFPIKYNELNLYDVLFLLLNFDPFAKEICSYFGHRSCISYSLQFILMDTTKI